MKDGAVCSSVFYNLHIFLKNLKDRSSNLTAVCVFFFKWKKPQPAVLGSQKMKFTRLNSQKTEDEELVYSFSC